MERKFDSFVYFFAEEMKKNSFNSTQTSNFDVTVLRNDKNNEFRLKSEFD